MSREFRALGRELQPEPEPRHRSVAGTVVGWAFRYLPEIALLLLLVRVWQWAAGRTGPLWTDLVGGVLVVGALWWGRSRRWLLALGGCVLTRARLRAALAELRLAGRDGRPPFILAVLPTGVGERVWLLCPVRVAAEDIADEADRLRAACFARGVRVAQHRRVSALVFLDVIRRDQRVNEVTSGSPQRTRAPARVAGHRA
jgi:hypothetical protein